MKQKTSEQKPAEPSREEILQISAKIIIKTLQNSDSSKKLDLEKKQIDDAEMLVLSKFLTQESLKIVELNLSESNITSFRIQTLGVALKK